jgi:hypothetical protein
VIFWERWRRMMGSSGEGDCAVLVCGGVGEAVVEVEGNGEVEGEVGPEVVGGGTGVVGVAAGAGGVAAGVVVGVMEAVAGGAVAGAAVEEVLAALWGSVAVSSRAVPS